MEPEAMILIEKLAKLVNQNTHQIVSYYTKWHLLAAYAWIFFGGFLMAASYKMPTPEGFEPPFPAFARGMAFIVGFVMVVANFPDVFAPEAYAIHQLIIDVRGR